MQYEIKQEEKFKYIEDGEGEPIVLAAWIIWSIQQFQGID